MDPSRRQPGHAETDRASRKQSMDTSAYKDFEVWGVSVEAYIVAFRQYPTVIDKYIARYGLLGNLTRAEATSEALRNLWIPMESWIRIAHSIVEEVGSNSAYSMGKRICET